MSFSNAAENSIMDLTYAAVAWANYADNAASSPQTNIVIAGHTGDPGDTGNQTTSELAYTSYGRVNVARSGSGWSASSNGSVSPVATITFPAGTGGSGSMTHCSSGKSGGGATAIIQSGTVTPNITTGNGVTPTLTTATTFTID